MSFTSLGTGGLYRDTLAAAIGIVNNSTTSIGMLAAGKINNISFTNNYGCTTSQSPGTIKNINHCSAVKREADGSNPMLLSPYIAVYFWRRTA